METLSQPKETKSRKDHTCDFCNEKIVKRSTYIRSTHTYDGSIYSWKAHKWCSKLASRLDMYSQCDEGVTQEDFVISVSQEHDDILFSQLPEDKSSKYSDVMQQLTRVNFHDKLWYVIRHFNKLDRSRIEKQH